MLELKSRIREKEGVVLNELYYVEMFSQWVTGADVTKWPGRSWSDIIEVSYHMTVESISCLPYPSPPPP